MNKKAKTSENKRAWEKKVSGVHDLHEIIEKYIHADVWNWADEVFLGNSDEEIRSNCQNGSL